MTEGPRVRIRLPPAGSQVRTRPHGFGDLPPASHASAVWLAHETAFAVLPDAGAARRGQYPMIVLMVAYTALGLWILAQPIVEPK
jgi:hypothetical protein